MVQACKQCTYHESMANLIGTNFIREKTGKSNRIWPTKIITWVILKKQRETPAQESIPNHLHVFGTAKPTQRGRDPS